LARTPLFCGTVPGDGLVERSAASTGTVVNPQQEHQVTSEDTGVLWYGCKPAGACGTVVNPHANRRLKRQDRAQGAQGELGCKSAASTGTVDKSAGVCGTVINPTGARRYLVDWLPPAASRARARRGLDSSAYKARSVGEVVNLLGREADQFFQEH